MEMSPHLNPLPQGARRQLRDGFGAGRQSALARKSRKKGVLENRTQVKNADVVRHEWVGKNVTWVRSTKRTQIQGGQGRWKRRKHQVFGQNLGSVPVHDNGFARLAARRGACPRLGCGNG